MSRRRFVFSVVTHNSANCVERALAAITARLSDDDLLVVVDNGSRDGTARLVRDAAPHALLIEQENLGFGRANNRAFAAADSEFFVLINPDVVMDEVDLDRVARYFADHPEVIALVGDVRNKDGSRQYVNRRFPALDVLLLRRFELPLVRGLGIVKRRLSHHELGDVDLGKQQRVQCGTGSFQFIRRSAIVEDFLFDPRFFLYFEDIDLSRRLWTRGETHYVPWLVVTHGWGRASYRSWRSTWRHAWSALQYLAKWKSFAPRDHVMPTRPEPGTDQTGAAGSGPRPD
ncbi:MAG: glycosyltransferase [Thermoanaerobaculales bacterium]